MVTYTNKYMVFYALFESQIVLKLYTNKYTLDLARALHMTRNPQSTRSCNVTFSIVVENEYPSVTHESIMFNIFSSIKVT